MFSLLPLLSTPPPGEYGTYTSLDIVPPTLYIGTSTGHVLSYSKDARLESAHAVAELVHGGQGQETKAISISKVKVLKEIGISVVLSGGILSFHSVSTDWSLLPSSTFPTFRHVQTFSFDDSELYNATLVKDKQAAEGMSFALCIIRKKRVWYGRMAMEGLRPMLPEEIQIPQVGFISRLILSTVCLADTSNYGLLELATGSFTPLMPVSSSSSSSPLRPCITVVIPGQEGDEDGEGAFLMATHNGENGTLGMFMNENGEPCRGTMEWESNTIAFAVDAPYVVSLLKNSTVQIHQLSSQRLVQTIPIGPDVKPRSISHTYSALYIPAPQSPPTATRPSSIVSAPHAPMTPPMSPGPTSTPNSPAVVIPPRPPSSTSSSRRPIIEEPLKKTKFSLAPMLPRTPPRHGAISPIPNRQTPKRRTHQRPLSVASASSLTTTFSLGGIAKLGGGGIAKTFVVGKDTVWAVWSMGLVGRVEECMGSGKMDEAVDILEREADDSEEEAMEKTFLYQRALWFYMLQTEFQKAGKLLIKARVDPRLIIRLFPDIVGSLLQNGEETEVFAGILPAIAETGSIEDIVVGNLYKNYAPHIKPDVESYPATLELKNVLMAQASSLLKEYLQQWRSRRRRKDLKIIEGYSEDQLKSIDEVIDTALAKLYVEGKLDEELQQHLRTANSCIISELDAFLKDYGRYSLLADIYLQDAQTVRVLELWTKLLDGVWKDPDFERTPEDVCALTLSTDDTELIWKYGFWLLDKDEELCLNVLTHKQALFTTREIYNEMKIRNPSIAQRYLESQIFQPQNHDAKLIMALLEQYLDSVYALLEDSSVTKESDNLEELYGNADAKSFAAFLLDRVSSVEFSEEGSSSAPNIKAYLTLRLKLMLLLSQTTDYDVVKIRQTLEEPAFEGLHIERAIVYGKLSMDPQALRLIISRPLRDVISAETYCIQLGDPILHHDACAISQYLSLPTPAKKKGKSGLKTDAKRNSMLKNLVKIMLEENDNGGREGDEVRGLNKGMMGLIDRQGVRLDTLEVLNTIPPSTPLGPMLSFFSRSIRRSLHERQEVRILKSLAMFQNLDVMDRWHEEQFTRGPLRVEGDDDGMTEGENGTEKKIVQVIKIE